VTATQLALWLSTGDAAERSTALNDLLASGDLALVTADSGELHLVRTHRNAVTRYEIGAMPMMATAMA
jgi:hypothetical protein